MSPNGIDEPWEGDDPCEDEGFEPLEDDAYIVDRPMKAYGVSFEGRFLGEATEYDDAVQLVVEAAAEAKFWPNLWFIDDHGGSDLRSY